MENKSVLAGLLAVQRDLKAPKNQYNSFGDYKYRSCEDILQAARPLCNENGLVLMLSDEVMQVSGRYYIKATASVVDIATGESVTNTALAREPEEKKKMDAAQVTGTASSYARKYALCGLFAIDDTKDADTEEYQSTDNGYANAMKKLNSVVKAAMASGVSKEEIKEMALAAVGKASAKDMTAEELTKFTASLDGYLKAGAGA